MGQVRSSPKYGRSVFLLCSFCGKSVSAFLQEESRMRPTSPNVNKVNTLFSKQLQFTGGEGSPPSPPGGAASPTRGEVIGFQPADDLLLPKRIRSIFPDLPS